MSNRMRNLFPPPPSRFGAPDHVNKEGAPSYAPTLREGLLEVLMLGTFGNAFYASSKELSEDALAIIKESVATDPLYTAKATVVARNEGYVRSAPIIALATLVAGDKEAKALARLIFPSIIRTADDLRSFVGFVQSGQIQHSFGGIAQRLTATWLRDHLDAYQAIKYAGSGERLSLRNILRLSHPKAKNASQNAIFGWLTSGAVSDDAPEMIKALGLLSGDDVDNEAIVNLIKTNHLPFEAVMPRVNMNAVSNKDVWGALLDNAPYMFLLRSLNAMSKAGVFSDKAALDIACEKISNPQRVAKSMQFPFRFLSAANALQEAGAPKKLINAVYDALEVSVGNIPQIGNGGQIVVAPDVSGSMDGTTIAKSVSASDVAGIFAGAIWKANPQARVIPFGTDTHESDVSASPRDTVMTIAKAIGKIYGGGTDLGAPVRALIKDGTKADLFIGITDSEDWAGRGFLSDWEDYKRKVNKDAKAVLIQLVAYGDRVVPPAYPGVSYVYGWSDQVLRYLAYTQSGAKMSEIVDAADLG